MNTKMMALDNVHESVIDTLRRTQEELGRHSRLARARTLHASVLWFAFGAALGMTGMVYLYEHQLKPQPVVVEIERSAAPTDPSRVPAALVKLTTVNRAMLAQLEQRERFVVKP